MAATPTTAAHGWTRWDPALKPETKENLPLPG
jgi:hypothetical protein